MGSPPPYRLFDTRVARKTALSPALTRITFSGIDLAAMKTVAPDQRIKIFLPDGDGRPSALPKDAGWYQAWRAVPPAERAPMRTYTIRHLRAEENELDVDFVLHGATGPASVWAIDATAGATVQIAAPNRDFAGDPGGYEWKPPGTARRILLIADETALPAAAGILAELAARPHPPRVEAFFEVPTRADCLDVAEFPGLHLHWLPRDASPAPRREGTLIAAAAERAWVPDRAATDAAALTPVDIDRDILWERAEGAGGFYAWVAGESEAVLAIRRTLIKERGVDKRAANLMGYWRRGRALDNV